MKFVRILLPLSFAPFVIFIAGVTLGGITGTNNIVFLLLQGLSNPAIIFVLYLNLQKQTTSDPELVRRRMQKWEPVRVPTIVTIFSGAVVEATIVILYPNVRGLIAALLFGAIFLTVMGYFVKRATKLSWKEILIGNI